MLQDRRHLHHTCPIESGTVKLSNRLTRRPCQGDEFEITIFEAQTQNAGSHKTCEKKVANMDIHFDWQAYDSIVKKL